MRSVKSLLGALLLGLAAGTQAENADDWFERMRSAVHSEDYEGRFVYQVGPQLEAMYVVHRISGDVELERLVSLNGDQKQVIRGDRAVACLEPGKHRISVLEGLGGPALGAEPDMQHMKQFYEFSLLAGQRAAGREARLIRVSPRDSLRFGYEITVDAQTALPLRTVMLDAEGEQQSQMMFVDLRTGPDIPPIERDVSALEMAQEDRITVTADVSDPASSGWQFEHLPAGFELRSYRADARRQHFIFSDGLATLSLYVEGLASDGGFSGLSKVGATRAYGDIRHGHQVTAVGEAPGETLRLMVNAIAPK
jgi:sigma-E factor negative regulatory protein RseB